MNHENDACFHDFAEINVCYQCISLGPEGYSGDDPEIVQQGGDAGNAFAPPKLPRPLTPTSFASDDSCLVPTPSTSSINDSECSCQWPSTARNNLEKCHLCGAVFIYSV